MNSVKFFLLLQVVSQISYSFHIPHFQRCKQQQATSLYPFIQKPSIYSNQYLGRNFINRLYSSFPVDQEVNRIKQGSLIEYVSSKGTKQICLVDNRKGSQIEVINEAKKQFTISLNKVTFHFNGTFAFGDLLRLNEILAELKPVQVERVWESIIARSNGKDVEELIYTLEYFTDQVFGIVDPVRMYATYRLFNLYGSVFFTMIDNNSKTQHDNNRMIQYRPLRPNIVQENLRDRAALREFKQRFTKVSTTSTRSNSLQGLPEIPERVVQVLESYSEGLKLIIAKSHPWTVNHWSRIKINETEISKGKELLEFLGLAPSSKNARKILEMMGIWHIHTNVEKYLMQLRDIFPKEVLEESQYILDNAIYITDMDERIRRDLRHLRSYAIDSEGASEVDDALSVEYIESIDSITNIPIIKEKIWIHIADVSRWIKPGSQLSLEAERRMSAVYMPDERISMFPEELSSQILSLGAAIDSYALSCGIILNAHNGSIESFEVCPSKIRITKKLSYVQLDEIIQKIGIDVDKVDNGNDKLDNVLGGITATRIFDKYMHKDLNILNKWAILRHKYRVAQGALDVYMRDKTELYLSVKKDTKNPNNSKMYVSGYTVWTNGTSISLVAEYMILMCQTMGDFCATRDIPVLYKTQSPNIPLNKQDIELQEGETPFIRATRLIKSIRPANDTIQPGLHCSSGSNAYVQCTSPIRRYHDLYNHYRLKAFMHAASMREQWASYAEELAGITSLDLMSSATERMATLNAIKMVTRQRDAYWLNEYMDRLIHAIPQQSFDCMIFGPHSEDVLAIQSTDIYDVLILQLGSFTRYILYSPNSNHKRGDVISCYLYRRYNIPQTSYILLPIELNLEKLPSELVQQLTSKSKSPEIDADSIEQVPLIGSEPGSIPPFSL